MRSFTILGILLTSLLAVLALPQYSFAAPLRVDVPINSSGSAPYNPGLLANCPNGVVRPITLFYSATSDDISTATIRNNPSSPNFNGVCDTTSHVYIGTTDLSYLIYSPSAGYYFWVSNNINSESITPDPDPNNSMYLEYILMEYDGTTWSAPPAVIPPSFQNNTAHITIIKPVFNETVDNEHDIEIELKNPQFLDQEYITYYNVYIRDYLTNITEYNYVGEMGTTTADQTLIATASTTDGSKFITVDMWTDVRDYPKASGFYNVNENTYLENTGLETPTAPPTGLSVINCTTFDFGCQIQRAFTFLFVPDRGLVTTLLDIEDQLQQKIPFKYFYGTVAMWEDLTLSTTTLPSLPVTYWNNQDPIDVFATSTVNTFVPTTVLNTFKLLATSAIWLAVLFYFWQMRLRVFNTKS